MIEAGVQNCFTAANQNDNVNAENWSLFSASIFYIIEHKKNEERNMDMLRY